MWQYEGEYAPDMAIVIGGSFLSSERDYVIMKNVRLRNEKYRTSVEIFLQRDCVTIVTIVSDLASGRYCTAALHPYTWIQDLKRATSVFDDLSEVIS